MGIGLLDAIRGAKKIIIQSPLSLETMRLMGIICKYRNGVYVMIVPPLEIAESEGDAAESS